MEHPSLESWLGAMDSDEFLARADALEALVQSPGFAFYREMVGVQVRKVQRQMVTQPMQRVQDYAQVGGHVRGLEQALDLVEKVRARAKEVRSQMDREAREIDGEAG